MAQQWYWMKNGQKNGPIETAGLKKLARSGQLKPTDMIWCEGLPKWVPATQAKGLFGGLAPGAVTSVPARTEATPPAKPPVQAPASTQANTPTQTASPPNSWGFDGFNGQAETPTQTAPPPKPTKPFPPAPAATAGAMSPPPLLPSAQSEPCCSDCKHRLPRNVCGNRESQFFGKTVAPKDDCPKFQANPAQGYFTAALAGTANGDQSSETTVSLLEAAIRGGLPQDDEVLARRFLAPAYLDLAFKRTPVDSVVDDSLFLEALKQLEYAVKVDSEQCYGVFSGPLNKAILVRFDACYAMQSNAFQKTRGPDAAIAFLEDKLAIYGRVPGDPMIIMLETLGATYYNDRQDHQRTAACFQRILNSEPIRGSEEAREEIMDRARKQLADMGEQPATSTQAGVMDASSAQERKTLIKRIIINVLFLIPYIILLSSRAVGGKSFDAGNPSGATMLMMVPIVIWGFIGYRWVLNAIASSTGHVPFASLQSHHRGLIAICLSLMCSGFGIIIIPVLILVQSIKLHGLRGK